MSRRLAAISVFLLVALAALGYAYAQQAEEEGPAWDTLEVFYFLDSKSFKIKIVEIPSGKVSVEATEKIDLTLGEMGAAVAKKYPKVWLVMGPITRDPDKVPKSPYLDYCMKHFKLEYLGPVQVRVPETELSTPQPQASLGRPIPIEETWGGESGEDDDYGDGDVEDDFEEPSGPPVKEVDAYIHLWEFMGKKIVE